MNLEALEADVQVLLVTLICCLIYSSPSLFGESSGSFKQNNFKVIKLSFQ